LLVVFVLILGAALFLSRSSPPRRAAATLAIGVGLALAGPLAFRAAAPAPEAAQEAFPWARLALAVGVALLAGLSVHLRSSRAALTARLGLAVLVLAELGSSLGPARRVWSFPVVVQGERPLFEGLLRAGLYGDVGVPPRVALPPWAIRHNSGLLYEWSNVSGYNALTLNRVWVYLHERLGVTPPRDENTYPSRRLYEHGPFPFASMNLVAGWKSEPPSAGRDSGIRNVAGWQPPPGRPVLRPATDPRAYLATSVERVGTWSEAVTAMAAEHDFHRAPLVETDTGLPAFDPTATAAPSPGRVDIVSFDPERVVLEFDASAPSLLVLAEAWYPGWSATVDGAPAALVPANAWMRGVPVPAGRHQVELRFRSRWLVPGALLSLLTAVGLALLVRRERRELRRSGARAR
jgi:hypothetical protein